MKKIRIIDYVLLVWCLLMLTLTLFSLFVIDDIQDGNIFYLFYSNIGVQIFTHIDLLLFGLMSCILLVSVWKKEFTRIRLVSLATLLVLLIIEGWLYIWYTSTFDYGCIRDKQGTWFPSDDLLYAYYLIWLLPLKRTKYNGLQWGLCIGATLLFIGLFELVLEPWHLNWL